MFSIVSMQDVLLNLKGGDQLFKKFDPPRIRKKSTGSRISIASKEKSDFPIKKVWVLPSHLIILIRNGGREDLLAYDQVPKLVSSDNEKVTLSHHDSPQVYDIFHAKEFHQEYVFVVLKTGEVVIWMFRKPEYTWKLAKRYSLCKGRDSQIVSYAYDKHTRALLWCEKRSASQFCICKANLKFPEGSARNNNSSSPEQATVAFEDVKAILHNCLPMNIYALSHKVFIFLPVSNKPQGLFMFWSNETDKIVVRIWGEEFNERSYVASTSDYQTIIKDCISQWIAYPSNDNKIHSLALHPSSHELIVVQSDLSVYTIQSMEHVSAGKNNEEVRAMFACTLEELQEGKELFLKQAIRFYPIQKMLMFVMEDGTIIIFEKKGGLFLWKTQTFRSGSPQVWIRKGDFPIAGVWNRSGIWNLRPKPISEQLKEFSANRYCVNNDNSASSKLLEPSPKKNLVYNSDREDKVSDPEFALNVFQDQQREQQQSPTRKPSRKLRIKQGTNRSEDVPVGYLFNILNLWQLNNVSMEIALNIATKIKELKESNEEVDLSEVFSVVEEINDPVLLLVLFGNRTFPFSVRQKMSCKIRHFLKNTHNTRSHRTGSNGHPISITVTTATTPTQLQSRLEPELLRILQQYIQIDDKIQKCYTDSRDTTDKVAIISTELSQKQLYATVVSQELMHLEEMICSGNTSLHALDKLLCLIMDLQANEFLRVLLNITVAKDKLHGTLFQETDTSFVNVAVSKEIWKLFFSESEIYRKICSYIWETVPEIILIIVNEGKKLQDEETADDSITQNIFQGFLFKTITLLNLPLGPSTGKAPVDLELEMDKKRVEVYCSLIIMLETETAKERCYDVLLNYGMVDQAFEILSSYGRENVSYSLVYQMLCYLINNKQLGVYAEKLKSIVQGEFKIAEFYNVLSSQSNELGKPPVFVNGKKGLSIGDLKPFLEILL